MNASGESYGIRKLTALFVAWKLLLIFAACASPGVGYDTSTQILFDQYGSTTPKSWFSSALEHLALRLTRWDGIYFASLAERGHVNEQDWAFSWALAKVTDNIAKVFFLKSSISPIVERALTGILISNTFHYLAVLTLYELATEILPINSTAKTRIAFTAAALHIASPAGVFLSAPYGESLFAFFSFAGMSYYSNAFQFRKLRVPNITLTESLRTEISCIINSGFVSAIAASVRGNGLLNGILFAWDAVELLSRPRRLLGNAHGLLRLAAIVLAGIFVGAGFVGPQVIAYLDFCTGDVNYKVIRPWCNKTPPSVYNWVQHHYWGVGFLRYWTFSNLPLFLIAGPVLSLLLWTGYICLRYPEQLVASVLQLDDSKSRQRIDPVAQKEVFADALRRLALPQLALVSMAATSFHVQIVNRISSGYPLWYIVLAIALHASSARTTTSSTGAASISHGHTKNDRNSVPRSSGSKIVNALGERSLQWVVRGMVMYAVIQGGLYASFLPPA